MSREKPPPWEGPGGPPTSWLVHWQVKPPGQHVRVTRARPRSCFDSSFVCMKLA